MKSRLPVLLVAALVPLAGCGGSGGSGGSGGAASDPASLAPAAQAATSSGTRSASSNDGMYGSSLIRSIIEQEINKPQALSPYATSEISNGDRSERRPEDQTKAKNPTPRR